MFGRQAAMAPPALNVPALAVAIAVPLVGGIALGVSTRGSIDGWYKKIKKPTWNPPNRLFGPVWTVLYASMGYASYLVYMKGGLDKQQRPLALYAAQLLLNFLWTPLFFKWNRLDLATLDIAALWLLIVATIKEFEPVIGRDKALWLLGPYLAWVTFASALTAWIWRNNPAKKARGVSTRSTRARAA